MSCTQSYLEEAGSLRLIRRVMNVSFIILSSFDLRVFMCISLYRHMTYLSQYCYKFSWNDFINSYHYYHCIWVCVLWCYNYYHYSYYRYHDYCNYILYSLFLCFYSYLYYYLHCSTYTYTYMERERESYRIKTKTSTISLSTSSKKRVVPFQLGL